MNTRLLTLAALTSVICPLAFRLRQGYAGQAVFRLLFFPATITILFNLVIYISYTLENWLSSRFSTKKGPEKG